MILSAGYNLRTSSTHKYDVHTKMHRSRTSGWECVWSSVERFSRARTLTWRPVGPRHTVFPTMKVLGWPAVYMWVYLVIFVCVSSMSV